MVVQPRTRSLLLKNTKVNMVCDGGLDSGISVGANAPMERWRSFARPSGTHRPPSEQSFSQCVIEEPQMGIARPCGLRVNLQHEFHFSEMIPQTSLNYFAGICKVLGLGWVRRPLPIAKIIEGFGISQYPPHSRQAYAINKCTAIQNPRNLSTGYSQWGLFLRLFLGAFLARWKWFCAKVRLSTSNLLLRSLDRQNHIVSRVVVTQQNLHVFQVLLEN